MIFMQHYLKYDDTDFCLEIAPITRVIAIKAKGSANYGPPCICIIMQPTVMYILGSSPQNVPMCPWEQVHVGLGGLWVTNSEGVKLIVRALIFQDF